MAGWQPPRSRSGLVTAGLFIWSPIPLNSQYYANARCRWQPRGGTLKDMSEPPFIDTNRPAGMQPRRRVPFPLVFAFSILCAALAVGGIFALALRSTGKL